MKLGDKLQAEWPGILAWMVEGCREWQVQGLAPPTAVLDASEDYLEAQELVGQFLDEKCVIDKKEVVASSLLFQTWKEFAEVQGEKPGHQRTFNAAMEAKGFKFERRQQARAFRGLTLRAAPASGRGWGSNDDGTGSGDDAPAYLRASGQVTGPPLCDVPNNRNCRRRGTSHLGRPVTTRHQTQGPSGAVSCLRQETASEHAKEARELTCR